MRIAIVGSGVAGLGAAWLLRHKADITLFEKQDRLGGHSHTVLVSPPQAESPIHVDTGFIVYNTATYPNLIALFDHLGVPTQSSDMSFAVSLDQGGYEYAGDNLATVIGHWQNLFRFKHWRLVIDALRFMRQGETLYTTSADETLGAYLRRYGFSHSFITNHILPMAAAIWSASPENILDFPARNFGQFFHNHGLLEPDIKKRPPWRTVTGGAKIYVDKILGEAKPTLVQNASIIKVTGGTNGATLTFDDGHHAHFDHVILATHADEAATLLDDASWHLKNVLNSFRYSANQAYLHQDSSLMPHRKNLWASWNYIASSHQNPKHVFVTYWMNRLQGIDRRTPLFVSLNPPHSIAPDKILKHMVYHHPQFDRTAMRAQSTLKSVQGQDRIWLCGSYFGYGFHEDALSSGLAVAEALGAKRPWHVTDISPAFHHATPETRHD